jgi:hypothetical protein
VLYLDLTGDIRLGLKPCSGRRYEEGEFVPCVDGCVAHFDVNAETDEGVFESPYPNCVLSAARLFVGSRAVEDLLPLGDTARRHDCVEVHRNDGLFRDAGGAPVAAWVVTLNALWSDGLFCAVFLDRSDAEELVAQLI